MQQDLITNRYYNNLVQIGQGGQGKVWRGISKRTNQEVAIKTINLTSTNRTMAMQEIMALTAISYPNCIPYVVCFHDSFYDSTTNQVVIEMDYISGPTVSEYTQPLRNRGDRPLLILSSKILLRAVLTGLKFIHHHNIIHNDIKPANIIVGSNRVPVIVDFGISCFTLDAMRAVCTQPYNKVIDDCCVINVGTSIYLPPEVMQQIRYPSSDLWSLGATVYEIMTGMNIWGLEHMRDDPYGLLRQVMNNFKYGIKPNILNSGDTNLDMIVNNFLSYDPSTRMSIDQALIYLY